MAAPAVPLCLNPLMAAVKLRSSPRSSLIYLRVRRVDGHRSASAGAGVVLNRDRGTTLATPDTLGGRLKGERVRRGLTLHQVSESTKIPSSLLNALERDDVSRWPKGLYRRAFFRAYVTALGLTPDAWMAEFARTWPDDTLGEAPVDDVETASRPATAEHDRLALTLAAGAGAPRWRAVSIALLEVATIVAVGLLAAWRWDVAPLVVSGAVALVYYPAMRVAGRQAHAPITQARGAVSPAPPAPAHASAMSGAAAAARQAVGWTAPRVTHATTVVGRTTTRAAVSIYRRIVRGWRAGNYAFWTAVRAAAEYAQVLAARQLNRTTQ